MEESASEQETKLPALVPKRKPNQESVDRVIVNDKKGVEGADELETRIWLIAISKIKFFDNKGSPWARR